MRHIEKTRHERIMALQGLEEGNEAKEEAEVRKKNTRFFSQLSNFAYCIHRNKSLCKNWGGRE